MLDRYKLACFGSRVGKQTEAAFALVKRDHYTLGGCDNIMTCMAPSTFALWSRICSSTGGNSNNLMLI